MSKVLRGNIGCRDNLQRCTIYSSRILTVIVVSNVFLLVTIIRITISLRIISEGQGLVTKVIFRINKARRCVVTLL